MKRGFTLIELLVVIAIVAVISTIVVLVLNPVEYIRRARDTQRLRDYTFIKQAINYYLYSTAVAGQTPDLDGPSYSNSCAGQAASKLFVSVPDGPETSPTPAPSGWTYNRVSSTALYSVSGSGWLPIDFANAGGGTPALTQLPVDPVNTFASGYYYTYTCGSFELNMKFESQKYTVLAQTDGGDDDSVYEVGSVLTNAPYQDSYHASTASASGTLVLYPSTSGFYSAWNGTFADVDEVTTNDSDRIYTSTSTAAHTFTMQNPSQTGTIAAVRLVVRADKVGLNAFTITPRLRATGSSQNYDSGAITLTTSYADYTTSFSTNPFTSSPWTWEDVNGLEAGVVLSSAGVSGSAQVSQIYLEVDYQ
jgi:prepilin-type N-terminal cleavage/methylation domain-containing protein